jgi:putative CRISPR-associated protein (TIGR02619 family)
MSKVIINTVGTSLLANSSRNNVDKDNHQAVMNYISADPKKACAETNALTRLLNNGDRAELLFSDTEEGRWCAERVADYLEHQGYSAEAFKVENLAYHAQGFVQYGLRQFVQVLTRRIIEAKKAGYDVLINATGGFKAEIAYATTVGLVFQTPVCYIHEKFGDIVTLPITPFHWDGTMFAFYRDFFDWIDEEVRPSAAVHNRAKGLPQEVNMLLEDTPDGYTMLSPLGEAYLQAFRAEKREQVFMFSKHARQDWERFDAATRQAYTRILDALQRPGRYSRAELKSGGGDALGYPKGHIDERVFFAEDDGLLYIFELTRHGYDYEKLCRSGLRWADYPRESFELVDV